MLILLILVLLIFIVDIVDIDVDGDVDMFQDFHLLVAIVHCFRDGSTPVNESFTLGQVMLKMMMILTVIRYEGRIFLS